MPAEELIGETPFSIGFVLEKLREAEGFAGCTAENLESFEAEDITGGAAFMSHIHRVKLKWKTAVEGRSNSIVLKVPGLDTVTDQYIELGKTGQDLEDAVAGVRGHLIAVHTREILFYQHFPRYNANLKLPRYYYGYEYSPTHKGGLIIMQDMSVDSSTVPMLPGMNDLQVLAVVSEIARFHATSWNHRDWVRTILNRPYNEPFMREMEELTLQLKTIKPEWFDQVVDKLLPHFNEDTFHKWTYTEDKYGFKAGLVHGDLWASNVMWRRDPTSGEPTSEITAVIDWQTVQAGNPLADIARFLGLNTTGEYRRANTERLLKLYWEEVTLLSQHAPSSYEVVLGAYKAALVPVALFMGFGAPMYLSMDSVVGNDVEERGKNQTELLSRVRAFFEDAVADGSQ